MPTRICALAQKSECGDLFDGDGGLPSFVFVEDGETDGARGVDIRMEQRRIKFACHALTHTNKRTRKAGLKGLTFGGPCWILVWEQEPELVHAILPRSPRLARNPRLPLHQIQRPVRRLGRLRIKALLRVNTGSTARRRRGLGLRTKGWSLRHSLRSSPRRLRDSDITQRGGGDKRTRRKPWRSDPNPVHVSSDLQTKTMRSGDGHPRAVGPPRALRTKELSVPIGRSLTCSPRESSGAQVGGDGESARACHRREYLEFPSPGREGGRQSRDTHILLPSVPSLCAPRACAVCL